MTKPTLVTLVVPVFNTGKALLKQALDSVAEQTLNPTLMQLHIVDDASTDAGTVAFVEKLARMKRYRKIAIKVSRNLENKWVAACRTLGARQAETDYVLFLDSDDRLENDYVKKAILLLEANPRAGWAYPGTRTHGDSHHLFPAKPFSVLQLLFQFGYNTPNVYRTRQWLAAGQRKVAVTGEYMIYEYWDTLIRLAANGHFGTPVQDSYFSHRSRHVTPIDRPTKIHVLSTYLTWRLNLVRLPLLIRAWRNHRRSLRTNTGQPALLNPARLMTAVQVRLLKKTFNSPQLSTALTPWQILIGLFMPQRFITGVLDPRVSITLAELRAGFRAKPKPVPPCSGRVRPLNKQSKILFAHTWRTVGGAENVLLDWLGTAREAGFSKVLEVTDLEAPDYENASALFADNVDEYFSLARIGETPGERRNFAWQLLAAEAPDLIFISGSSIFYSLIPFIRQWFPDTKIVDILHNEWSHQDWFNVAAEYNSQLDKRIVISEHWRDVLINRYGVEPERISVQHNRINTNRFRPLLECEGVREGIGLPVDKKIIAFIGRLHEQKNPRIFLELARINQSNPLFHFLVVGDGELMAPLRSEFPLPNVTFYGVSLQVEQIMKVIDVLVFTSTFEGYPLASLEAAATNIPVIAPDIVGFREQIQRGKFGLLYEPSGQDSTDAQSIQDILMNRSQELQELGDNGRPFVFEHHSITAGRDEQIGLLRSLQREDRLPTVTTKRKKTLYLHIGLTKTGSSSIQHFLYLNRDELLKQGLQYPMPLTYGRAHHILAHFFNERNALQRGFLEKLYKNREEWQTEIIHEIENLYRAPTEEIVLSSEAFRLATPELVAKYLQGFDIKIIVFFRRQDLWLESSSNQNRKMHEGEFMDIEVYAERMRWMLDYAQFLEPWEKSFGQENITVVPFEKANFSDGLERTFLQLIGKEATANCVSPGIVNAKLSRDCLAYLDERFVDANRDDTRYNRVLVALERYTALHPDLPENRFTASPQKRLRVLESFESGNADVARKYLGRDDGQLFRDPLPDSSEPWSEYAGITEEKILELDRYLEAENTTSGWIRSKLKVPAGMKL